MKVLKIINRETGKVDSYDMNHVKSYTSADTIVELRKNEDHALFSMIIEFIGLPYDLAMYEVDKFDLVVEG